MALNNLFKKQSGNQNQDSYDTNYDNDYYDNFNGDSYGGAQTTTADSRAASLPSRISRNAQPAAAGLPIGGGGGSTSRRSW